jgi:hypothetical protein
LGDATPVEGGDTTFVVVVDVVVDVDDDDEVLAV